MITGGNQMGESKYLLGEQSARLYDSVIIKAGRPAVDSKLFEPLNDKCVWGGGGGGRE